MKKSAEFKLISVAVPYVAVLIGLYVLKNAWIAIGIYHFGIAFFLITGEKNNLLRKIRTGWNPIMAAAAVAAAFMIFPVIYIFWKHMQLDNMDLNSALADFGLQGASWLFFMIYFATVHPFLEEFYWRGYMKYGCKYFSWTDFAFAGYHILVLAWFIKLPWLVIAFIVLSVAAYSWRYIAYKFKGLMIPLLSHIAADISIIVVANTLIH